MEKCCSLCMRLIAFASDGKKKSLSFSPFWSSIYHALAFSFLCILSQWSQLLKLICSISISRVLLTRSPVVVFGHVRGECNDEEFWRPSGDAPLPVSTPFWCSFAYLWSSRAETEASERYFHVFFFNNTRIFLSLFGFPLLREGKHIKRDIYFLLDFFIFRLS